MRQHYPYLPLKIVRNVPNMTFWEQYKTYLKEKSLSMLWITLLTTLIPLGFKLLTGKHHLLDMSLRYMSMSQYLVGSFIGICIVIPLISAIQVYINRKYDKE